VAFADAAKDRGAEVVAITDTGLSPMRRIDAVALLVDETDFGAFRPLAATVTLAITLGVAIGTARGTRQNK
jgi:DNA-binding MurR/RpiR family transcriptional regulator